MIFFSCLVCVALIPPCDINLENKTVALCIKSLTLRLHIAIQWSSENIDPWKIVDGNQRFLQKTVFLKILQISYEICESFKNTYFEEHLQKAASVYFDVKFKKWTIGQLWALTP